MARFVDVYMHACVPGYPAFCSPRFSTELTTVASGGEKANQLWENPLNRYMLPELVRTMEVFNALRDHWLVMAGPARSWPWRDPLDCASVPLYRPVTESAHLPAVSMTDQYLGVGDGVEREFQLTKLYARGSQTYTRTIKVPVVSSVLISTEDPLDDAGPLLQVGGYTITRPGGVVRFDVAPPEGFLLKWGGYFDIEVRFESDDTFDGIVKTFGLSGSSDLTLVEIRGC